MLIHGEMIANTPESIQEWSLQDHINKYRSIAHHIIDGSITIDSIPEFDNMLKLFPNNPTLFSAFGDLLVKKKQFKTAVQSYKKASRIYTESGMILSAILCQISAWRIIKPSHQQARLFFTEIKKVNTKEGLLRDFIHALTYPELVAITNRLVRLHWPSGKVIKKIGDVETDLYFIASGTVRDTLYKPLDKNERNHKKSPLYLYENDIFGDVYPFEEENISQSYTETVTGVEIGKITKSRLIEICKTYPNIAAAVIKLFETSAILKNDEARRQQRKSDRHALPIRVELEVFPEESDDTPYTLHGFSRDISVGGVCIVLDVKYADVASYFKTFKDAKIRISFPSESFTLNVSGRIMWNKYVYYEGKKTIALGVQFKEMTPKMSGMLIVFADMLYHTHSR